MIRIYKQAKYKIHNGTIGSKINVWKKKASDERKNPDNTADKHRLFNSNCKCKQEKYQAEEEMHVIGKKSRN